MHLEPVTPIAPPIPPLRLAARRYVAQRYLLQQDPRRLLHDEGMARYLEQEVAQLALQEQTAEQDALLATLAALFYPLGWRLNRNQPGKAVAEEVRQFLQQQNQLLLATELERCLQAAYTTQPEQLPERLLLDALNGTYCNEIDQPWADLRQLEEELLHGSEQRLAQAQLRLQEFLNLRFYTSSGKLRFQHRIAEQMQVQRKKIEKLQRNATTAVAPSEPFAALETERPVRAAQTYFRAVYRNHINLSAIADNKANIMISVNAILISVLITFLSYRNIAETQPSILLPVVVFMVTGLASLVCAVLSARPKVTQNKMTSDSRRGLAFFGNFVQLDLPTFTEAMDDALNDGSLLYGNMVEDLYHLGKVLDKKYRYLTTAYNVFMIGLIATVLLFLVTLFLP